MTLNDLVTGITTQIDVTFPKSIRERNVTPFDFVTLLSALMISLKAAFQKMEAKDVAVKPADAPAKPLPPPVKAAPDSAVKND
jgi:hypothetical protein